MQIFKIGITFLVIGLQTGLALDGGHTVKSARYLSAVQISGIECSGTKIAEHFLLTAAHCVLDESSARLHEWVQSGQAISIRDSLGRASMTKVIETYVHPTFQEALSELRQLERAASRVDVYDLAIIQIEDVIELPSSQWSDQSLKIDDEIWLTGFGGESRLKEAHKKVSLLLEKPRGFLHINGGNDRAISSGGDSGSGVYKISLDGQLTLVGVVSSSLGSIRDAKPEDPARDDVGSVFVRLDQSDEGLSARRWISDTMIQEP